MTLGKDTDIWPLSLSVIKRACWNNYSTCVWRFTLALRHGQLSDGGGWWGWWPAFWHGTTPHSSWWEVRVQGLKVGREKREWRHDEGQLTVSLGGNLVRAEGQGAPTLPALIFQRTGGPRVDMILINKYQTSFHFSLLHQPSFQCIFTFLLMAKMRLCSSQQLTFFSQSLHVHMHVLNCPSLKQHPQPRSAPSFHGGILGTAARP